MRYSTSEAEIPSWPKRDRPVLSLCCGRGACSPQSIGPPGAPLPRIFTAGLWKALGLVPSLFKLVSKGLRRLRSVPSGVCGMGAVAVWD